MEPDLRKSKKSKSSDQKAASKNDQEEERHKYSEKAERKRKKKEDNLKLVPVNEDFAMYTDAQDDQQEKAGEKKKRRKRKGKVIANTTTDDGGETAPSENKSEDGIQGKKKRKRDPEILIDETFAAAQEEDHEYGTQKREKQKHESADQTAGTIDDERESKKQNKKRKKDAAATVSQLDGIHSCGTTALSVATPSEVKQFLETHSITVHTPSNAPSTIPILSFQQLNIPSELRTAFNEFKEPTPIQACTWPPALKGFDVVGIAETGSGKTLAFGIPALCRLISQPKVSPKKNDSTVNVLVLAPTRELAVQTHETLSALGVPFGITSVAVFGGVPKEPQVKMLKNANENGLLTRIIVGTPGRILDLAQEGVCDLSQVDYLVLDEADRMLDKGFENDIRNIISQTKPSAERQTMMFSATWPEAVRRLASTFQKTPVRVTVGSEDLKANSRVQQNVEVLDDSRQKDARLLALLKSLSPKKKIDTDLRILVFALYKKEASRLEQMLKRQGYTVGALHGDMNQNARMDALEKFKNGTIGLLVATDVAARGLDIPNVGIVINYTFPLTIEDYVHRIGRTGRGGKSGRSVTFFTGDNHEKALAGELVRVLREGGFNYEGLKKFPMTIKKKEHSVYGAFYRDDIPLPKGPTKIVF